MPDRANRYSLCGRYQLLPTKLNRMLAPYHDYLVQDITFNDIAARSLLKPRLGDVPNWDVVRKAVEALNNP